ncbi:hypothetical protein FZEAL_1126 [Fusarium zealandicum]|uniref:Uncharacterized protein n=1 Tax=Fusarium zealandicum TaxID=1053134 RepID=A0A8H4UTW1_9HYPO|nr:hypothetical protein FZEAL_1126 [Fusarium zealandicum]
MSASRPSSHHFGSSSSTSTTSSSSSDSDLSSSGYRHSMDSVLPIASVEVLRCMRCARSVEATSTDDLSTMGMVRIAHNLYYCDRCAKTDNICDIYEGPAVTPTRPMDTKAISLPATDSGTGRTPTSCHSVNGTGHKSIQSASDRPRIMIQPNHTHHMDGSESQPPSKPASSGIVCPPSNIIIMLRARHDVPLGRAAQAQV